MGADNTGQPVDNLRIRKLNVTAPPALAKAFIQRSVIDQGILLKNVCGEAGDGSFSWLIQWNPSTKQLMTGGAPPTDDPFGKGYCFVNETVNGLTVKPITVNMTQNADGSWSSDNIPKLYVPIYLMGDVHQQIILPLTNSKVENVTLSTDGNCIGSYNPSGVTSPNMSGTCDDQDPSSCQRWHTAGSLGGYITLKEADGVNIPQLGKSLCVLLTNGTAADSSGTHCAKDSSGNVTAQGDFCSMPGMPGGCQDSSWLAATVAAGAAKITAGSDVPQCNGSLVVGGGDGGTDGGGTVSDGGGSSDGATTD
jgi:hypothetical protein